MAKKENCCLTKVDFKLLNTEVVPAEIQITQFIQNMLAINNTYDESDIVKEMMNVVILGMAKSIFKCNLKGKNIPQGKGKFTWKKIIEGKI